jgi:hypothetical protein
MVNSAQGTRAVSLTFGVAKTLDFRGSFWNGTTAVFSDWFDQLLHTGASGGVALGGSRCVHQVIRAAGGDRLLLHGRRCVGLVHLQLSRSVNKWESLYE